MLNGSNQQILTAYEVEGMSPEEIAADFNYDLVAVKTLLMQFSALYREKMQTEVTLDYTVDEQKEARDAIVRLMRTSEDENLVARLAMRIRDDAKGRLDVDMNKGLNINVNQFNLVLIKAREAKARAKAVAQPKPAPLIELEPQPA